MEKLLVKAMDRRAKLPRKGYDSSAGYDLFPMEVGVIEPGESKQIRLGFATAFDEDYVAIIDDRGSTGKVSVSHHAGVIDADYRGEWIIIMQNHGSERFQYNRNKAIAQVLFFKKESPKVESVEQLPESIRGEGKFGSSGH